MDPHSKTAAAQERAVMKAGPQKRRRGRPRQSPAEADLKRQQILSAALEVFSAHGFDAARLDEVARKAGVAKGTLYLYYPNKQAMFEALVHTAVAPLLEHLSELSMTPRLPAPVLLERIFALFCQEILGTERKLIIRLVISEGARFPHIAAFYHREIISRVMSLLKSVARQAYSSGELATEGPVHFPQLIAAPLLLSVIWDGLFEHIDPLDVEAMLAAHVELLTKTRGEGR